MNKEISLEDALTLTKDGRGSEVVALVPFNNERDGYRKTTFDEVFKNLNDCIFLIKDEISTTSKVYNCKEENTNTTRNLKAKKIDIGKLYALYRGGWTVSSISEELHISTTTVNKYLKKIRNKEIDVKGYIEDYENSKLDT